MDRLRITVVGSELFKMASEVFESVGLKQASEVRSGQIGNMKSRTYIFELDEDEIIPARRAVMNAFGERWQTALPMYVHGDWMRLFIFRAIRD